MKWPKLMCLTRDDPDFSHAAQVHALCEAEAKWIQLRCKDLEDSELEPIAVECRDRCRRAGCSFILNDRLDLALKIEADGVHLGKLDPDWGMARSISGPDFIIGGTVNGIADAERAVASGVLDYVGVGPFRYTKTKKNLAPVLGDSDWENILRSLGSLPAYAIGGIRISDMPKIKSLKVRGTAVCAPLFHNAQVSEDYKNWIAAS